MISKIKQLCGISKMEFAPRYTPISRRRFELLSASAPGVVIRKEIAHSQKIQIPPSAIEMLPLDVLAECLSFLTARDIASFTRVNKDLHQKADSEVVWRLLCRQYFSNCDNVIQYDGFSWKAYFKEASEFEWDVDNSTMDSQVPTRSSSLLTIRKNKITKAICPRDLNNPFHFNVFETAASCSKQSMSSGIHCYEFVINQHDDNYNFAIGLIDCCETSFNFTMASYSDGENISTPTTCHRQCFYWSNGQFSDILGLCTLTGALTVEPNIDTTFRAGNIIGMKLNMEARQVTFYKDNTKIAQYSFALNNNNNNEEDICNLHIGIYMFAEGDEVQVRQAPLHLYE